MNVTWHFDISSKTAHHRIFWFYHKTFFVHALWCKKIIINFFLWTCNKFDFNFSILNLFMKKIWWKQVRHENVHFYLDLELVSVPLDCQSLQRSTCGLDGSKCGFYFILCLMLNFVIDKFELESSFYKGCSNFYFYFRWINYCDWF